MPELAEVEYFRKQWEAGHGSPIVKVEVHAKARPLRGIPLPELVRHLTGARLASSTTHGKQIFFRFHPDATLGIHLGMTGRLSVREADAPQEKHDHLVLRQAKRALVFTDFRMFGRVRFAAGKERPAWETDLPAEVLSAPFTPAYLRDALQRRARTPIKAALLDQAFFPGIGNWMADEVLWQARIAPQRPAGAIAGKDLTTLHGKLRSVCRISMETIGKEFNDAPASWLFSRRWKKGGSCPRCHGPLRHATLRGRTACWCPKCQPK